MKYNVQKHLFTNMVLTFFTALILLSCAAAMTTPSAEFGAADLVSLGVFSAPKTPRPSSGQRPSAQKPLSFTSGTNSAASRGPASAAIQQALLIATAKRGDKSAHPSVPFLTVDITQSSPGCGPFDWIFRPDCSPPRLDVRINARNIQGMNKLPLPNSFLYVYIVPLEAENIRITLPNYGSCGRDGDNSRTGDMKVGSKNKMCNRAQFRRRHCRRRLLVFRRCSLRDCDTLVFTTRLITSDADGNETVIPYVASGNGFETCSTDSIARIFGK